MDGRWDKLAKEISSDDEENEMRPRLRKFHGPSRVTVRNGEVLVEDDTCKDVDLSKLKPPDMISEKDLLAHGHTRSDWEHDQPLQRPVVESWSEKERKWKAVDYSRWDNLDVSVSEKPEDDPDAKDEMDHVQNNLCRRLLLTCLEARA